jgi:hypothetical protein
MERQVIFGVFDKMDKCGAYTGFFKHEDDAKKELKSQMSYAHQELGLTELVLKNDRVVKMEDNVEIIYYIIHPIMLR